MKEWFDVRGSQRIGEYWVLSGHPNGTSIAGNGPLAGQTLQDIVERYPEFYLGNSPQPRFPLLIKFLEAHSDLSVQVHPDDDYALTHEGDYGKSEAWYVLDCKPEAYAQIGHRFPNEKAYFDAISSDTVRAFLNYLPIEKHQLIYVPAGTLHALLTGTIVVEIQQTSDVTYRVYDWDRMGERGARRPLHVERAADVLTFGISAPFQSADVEFADSLVEGAVTQAFTGPGLSPLLRAPHFNVDRVSIGTVAQPLSHGRAGNPDILVMIDGSWEIRLSRTAQSVSAQRGDAVLVPAQEEPYRLQSRMGGTALRVFY